MPTTTTLPNGQIITSTALLISDIETLLQRLTAQALGLYTTDAATDWSKVRLQWQTNGQPGWAITEDIAFLRAVEDDDPFTRIRDEQVANQYDAGGTLVTVTTTYTRAWRVEWTLYGPSSYDRARMLRSDLFADDFHDGLAQAGLYMITDVPAPRRAPENFNEQWWERVDFSIRLYEGVTETRSVQTMAGVSIVLASLGTVSAGFGVGPFGGGEFGDQTTIGPSSTTITIEE